jgi:hypothetical protein
MGKGVDDHRELVFGSRFFSGRRLLMDFGLPGSFSQTSTHFGEIPYVEKGPRQNNNGFERNVACNIM